MAVQTAPHGLLEMLLFLRSFRELLWRLEHRQYAATRVGLSNLCPRKDRPVSGDALVAFMIPKRLLDQLVSDHYEG